MFATVCNILNCKLRKPVLRTHVYMVNLSHLRKNLQMGIYKALESDKDIVWRTYLTLVKMPKGFE